MLERRFIEGRRTERKLGVKKKKIILISEVGQWVVIFQKDFLNKSLVVSNDGKFKGN